MLNIGPTRADDLPGVDKIELPTGLVMRDVAKSIMYVIMNMLFPSDKGSSGHDRMKDPLIHDMLHSGIVKPPVESNTLSNNARSLSGT